MLKIKIELDRNEQFKRNVDHLDNRINHAIDAVFDYNAGYAEGWMRENAPWTDRTGAARSGLMAISSSHESVHELLMAYSVTYGIWLEIANSGKYQVLIPAMRHVGQKILEDLKQVIYRL